MQDIRISVIIPVYNAGKTLAACLESVLSQPFAGMEVLCIDDGSTDNSPKILQAYADRDARITVLTQENAGAGAARNRGIAHARGEYLCFLDADDLLLPNALQTLYETGAQSCADVVLSGAYQFRKRTHRRTDAQWVLKTANLPGKSPFCPIEHREKLFQVCAGVPWAKLFRRDHIASNGIVFPPLPRAEDFPFVYLALACAGTVAFAQARTVLYRNIEGGSSLEHRKDRAPTAPIDAYLCLWEALALHGLQDALRRTFIELLANGLSYNMETLRTRAGAEAFLAAFQTRLAPRFSLSTVAAAEIADKEAYARLRALLSATDLDDYVARVRLMEKRTVIAAGSAVENAGASALSATEKDLPAGASAPSAAEAIPQASARAGVLRRILQGIALPFRMVRGLFGCIADHGMRYTCNRVLIRLHLKDQYE